ncbi:hypothetical protein ACFV5N_09235 [Streptomyces sp. NPDC059853]|uniref:hypothetical protein n=1 Tax=Streptomyces sp. NPDC059853 TaxID=3346973 RepID=UPI00366A0103
MSLTYLPAAQLMPGDVIYTDGRRTALVLAVEADAQRPGRVLISVGWESPITLAQRAAVAVATLQPRPDPGR